MKNNLAFMLHSRNITVTQLAKEINVSRNTIYRILNGHKPSAVVMIKLANYFERPIGDLFCA